jgi:hypothetical protein
MSYNEYPPGFAAGIAALTAAAHDRTTPRVNHGLPTDPAELAVLMEAEGPAPQRPDLFDRLTEQYGYTEGSALYQRAGEWMKARSAEEGHAELTAAITTALDAAAEGEADRARTALAEAISTAKGLKGLWTVTYAPTWDEIITGLESLTGRASEIAGDRKAAWRFGTDLTALGHTVRNLME